MGNGENKSFTVLSEVFDIEILSPWLTSECGGDGEGGRVNTVTSHLVCHLLLRSDTKRKGCSQNRKLALLRMLWSRRTSLKHSGFSE